MNVIGVDTNSRGFAWYATVGGSRTGRSGWFESPDDDPEVRRLEAVSEFGDMLLRQSRRGDWLAIEEPLALPKNGKTTRLLGLMAGALWAVPALRRSDITIVWANVASWKKHVVGNGNASKADVAEWAIPKLQAEGDGWTLQRATDCPDLYDAYAIAKYGRMVAHREAADAR